MRRAAASILMNIAEGCGRDTENDLARFLVIAMGSASELEYQLILIRNLHFIDSSTYTQLDSSLTEIKKMVNTFL